MPVTYGRLAGNPGVCRHCLTAVAWRPRRLCWSCYRTPTVRALYLPMPQTESGRLGGRRGTGDAKNRFLPQTLTRVTKPKKPGARK